MTAIKPSPQQPFVERGERFDWEKEETLVDRRNRLPYRISRFVRQWWVWFSLLGLIVLALYNAAVMTALIAVVRGIVDFASAVVTPPALPGAGGSEILRFISVVIQFVVIILAFIFQFVVFFWIGSRSRMYTIWPGQEGVGFKDYRGQPELLEQAQQIVLLLRGVKAFEGAGGEPLNGLLLEGPPGTGKTWLAQAISTEAGVPFFFVDASSLQGTFVGLDSIKVSRLYGKARRAARDFGAAVVFMDEIDSIGSRGGVSRVGGQDDGRPGGMGGMMGGAGMGLLSTMLIEMSGFSLEHGWRARLRTAWYRRVLRRQPPRPHKRVLTIGATNRIEALDPALLRPGRFDKKIRVDAPDLEGRRDIFQYYLSKMSHDETMEPLVLAADTPNYTPADIKYLLNEALRYALFDGRRYMTYRDFQLAQPEHEMGLRSPIKGMTREAKLRVAYHEAGHAVAVRLFQPHHRISRITIVRQGRAYGHVTHYPARESFTGMMTKDQWIDRLRVAVAGKAAEIEFQGLQNQTLGVGGDFYTIRNLLLQMGMAGMLGPLGATARPYQVPGAVAEAMEELFMHALVETLMEREELLADDVRAFFDRYDLHTPEPALIRDGVEVALDRPRLPGGSQELPGGSQ
jgi:ATP-dependent Zn protease